MSIATHNPISADSPAARFKSGWGVILPQPDHEFTRAQYVASPDGTGGCVVLGKYTVGTGEVLFRAFWINAEGEVLAKDLCQSAGVELVLIRLNGGAAYFLCVATGAGPRRIPDILKLRPTGELLKQALNAGEFPLMPKLPDDPSAMFTVVVGERGEPEQVRRIAD